MSSEEGSTTFGYRTTTVSGLKILKSPAEGGTEKDLEDFKEAIERHVSIAWKFGNDISHVIKELALPTVAEPEEWNKEEKSTWKKELWLKKVAKYGDRMEALEENLQALYSLMFGNLSKLTKSKVISVNGYSDANDKKDPIWLMDVLDDIMTDFEKIKSPLLAVDDQMERIMSLKQKPNDTNEDFVKMVLREIKIFKRHNGNFMWGKNQDENVAKAVKDIMEEDSLVETKRVSKAQEEEKIAAMTILKRADKKRFGNLLIKLQNSYLIGNDEYPKTAQEALRLLNNYKQEWTGNRTPERPPGNVPPRNNNGRNTSVSFLQAGGESKFLKGTNGSFVPRVTCHLCGFKGHKKWHCPVAINDQGDPLTGEERNANGGVAGEEEQQEVGLPISKCRVLLNQQNHTHLNPWYILLDSESNENIFCNEELVTNIHETTNGEGLRLNTNGGHLDTKQKAQFGDFEIWFNRDCLANILSLALVSDLYRVTLDTEVDNAFNVHLPDNSIMRFFRNEDDLYVFDASTVDIPKLKKAFCFMSTVDANKGMFKAREVRKADLAIELNRRTNHSAKDKFVRIVKEGLIRNCPVTVGDVRRSQLIYGPLLPAIKGRTRYQESPRVRDFEIIQLPKELYDDLKFITLCIDFHYVNGIIVFHSISRKVNYRTVSFPLSRSKARMLEQFKLVQQKYHARGFKIVQVHGDNEFEKIREEIRPARLVCCGVDDHVPEVERSIQTQKNENRSVCHAMPYKCIPRVMVRAIVSQGNSFLNAFGGKEGIGAGLTPRNVIDNLPNIDYNDLKYELGEYVQLHITQKRTNTMQSRTIGAIVLDPRDVTGRYNFMSLETGHEIDGRVVARLPITDAVIERVETLGREQNQPYSVTKMLRYEWRPGNPIGDDDVYVVPPPQQELVIPEPIVPEIPAAGPNPFNQDDAGANQGANVDPRDDDDDATGHQNEGNATNQGANQEEDDEDDINQGAQGAQTQNHTVDDNGIINVDDDEEHEIIFVQDSDDDSEEEKEIEARREAERQRRSSHWDVNVDENHGRGKREKKKRSFLQSKLKDKMDGIRKGGRVRSVNKSGKGIATGPPKQSYSFLQKEYINLEEDEKKEYFGIAWKEFKETGNSALIERFTTGLVFAQMSVEKGLRTYGKEAEIKLMEEFTQLLEYQVFHGLDASKLTGEEKAGAADMISIVEEKLNRGHRPDHPVIKVRNVFNGSVQRGLYSKEDTASPTVSVDSFLFTSMIDAIEKRYSVVTDVKGAYLHAVMKDRVIMRIKGKSVDFFCELDPTLKEFVTMEKGKKMLYVQLDKALYGCVQSALLWYQTYSSCLTDMGFVLNPYDPCVANAIIDGSQCTVCWYVDDNKISHKDKRVVENVVKQIEDKFGKMTQTGGEELEFLGMNIKHRNGKIEIGMKKHIKRAMELFPEEIAKTAATPAKSYLFEVREGSKQLDEERADSFHSVVASLLYVSRRSRLDIQTAIGFLCTRVSCPDEDDWVKLRRVLQYLNGTMDLTLILGADDMQKMKSWVDVSYGVHHDCKSHTGGCASFGWGVLLTMCQKQKLNVKSSTEGETVGASDYLSNIIWARMFLEAQGFKLTENILFQDNMSAIKLEKNGKMSSGKRTKHMDIRYFWIKDRIKTEGIEIKYCPTQMMIADFFTKPLQGNLFKRFRDVIMGQKHIDSLEAYRNENATPQERVGKDKKSEKSSDSNGGVSNTSFVTKNVSFAEVVKR